MKTLILVGLVFLASLHVGAWAEGETPEGETPDEVLGYLTPENMGKLETGKLIIFKEQKKNAKGKSKGMGMAIGLIDRPVDTVWAVIQDPSSKPKDSPQTVLSETYTNSEGQKGVHEVIKVLWKKVEYHVLQDWDNANYTVSWALDNAKKNDIADTTGYWRFIPHTETQCIGVYAVRVDTGMKVPAFLEDFLVRQDLPNAFKSVKKRAESDETREKS